MYHDFGYKQKFTSLNNTNGLIQHNAILDIALDKVSSYSAHAHSAIKKLQELPVQGTVPWCVIRIKMGGFLITCTYP